MITWKPISLNEAIKVLEAAEIGADPATLLIDLPEAGSVKVGPCHYLSHGGERFATPALTVSVAADHRSRRSGEVFASEIKLQSARSVR